MKYRVFIKRLAAVVLAATLLTACSNNKAIDPTLAYCTRAVVAMARHMSAEEQRFVISHCEYDEAEDMKKVTIVCVYKDYSNHVFVVGDGGEFFTNAENNERGVRDDVTGLYVIAYGDKAFLKDEDKQIDTTALFENFTNYTKEKDPIYIGMQGE